MVDDESITSIKLRQQFQHHRPDDFDDFKTQYWHLHQAPLVPSNQSPASPAMKPVVGAFQAWSCFVLSIFAIIILSILGLVYKNGHEEFVGGIDDPEDGSAVASTIFVAVFVYIGFLVCCGLQGLLHMRESRRGAIAL
ncbi:hypothetical protein INS49_008505 [Diaporthe citri]|uniref:uncharacterized protein n=1 Tax=Diaporthe citri TaxID=83186 RepID=UPI001C80CCC6|nr:uncharacterized protein INS49_008505 [Diaporthe citri]KAG6363406.1 hypothetical protein INS49_008505 [Diaporthe citri]